MRSTNRKAKLVIRQHIIDFYPSYEDLSADLLGASYNGMTTYQSARRMVEGCCFLVNGNDVTAFLSKVFEKDAKPNLDHWKQWETYVHLLAREITYFWERGGYHL